MVEEGKFSRALAKANAEGQELSGVEEVPVPPPGPLPAARPSAPREPSFQRVEGQCGEPAPDVVMVHDTTGEAACHIRALRARILAINKGRPPRVITISSGSRQEGKTTLAFNLAAALKETEHGRVVVVDGDVLAPGLHRLAALRPEKGLRDLLVNGFDLNGSVYETAVQGLDVIPSLAPEEADGHETLISQRAAALFTTLRRHYSFVIVDTPPVLAGSQAALFGKHSDGVLVAARLERTPRHVVKRAVDELVQSGADVIGCILTHRKHHIPNLIYRFLGTPPQYYYQYSRKKGR